MVTPCQNVTRIPTRLLRKIALMLLSHLVPYAIYRATDRFKVSGHIAVCPILVSGSTHRYRVSYPTLTKCLGTPPVMVERLSDYHTPLH